MEDTLDDHPVTSGIFEDTMGSMIHLRALHADVPRRCSRPTISEKPTMTFLLRSCTCCSLLLVLFATATHAQENKTLHDAIKPVPRAGGWMKRHEAMNTRVKQGNVDLGFIGDSITQG